MNKRFTAAAVAAMITLTAGVAMAADPVQIDGSVTQRYREDDTNAAKKNGSITRFTLNAKSEVATNLSIYARFAAEGLSNPKDGKDFNDATGNKDFIGQIDQYGLLYSNAGFTYKLGQQAPTIGALGLIYDASGYLGKQDYGVVDGINITGKTGVTSIDFLAAKENNVGDADNKIYALRASYNPVKDLTLGATFAQYKQTTDNTNYYAADANYVAGKATYYGEFLKSSADTKNNAYALGISYAPDTKNTLWINNYNVEVNSTITQDSAAGAGLGAEMTAYEKGFKGFYYGADHKFTKTTALHIFYRDMKAIDSNTFNTSFRATVSYKF